MRINPGFGFNRRGSVLILALVFAVVVTIISVGSLSLIRQQARMSGRSVAYQRALAIAEAGAESAMNELNKTSGSFASPWSGSASQMALTAVPLTDDTGAALGSFSVTVSDLNTQDPIITSFGSSDGAFGQTIERGVRIATRKNLSPSPFGNYGIYSKTSMGFSSSVISDSYNSAVANYNSNTAGSQGHIGAGTTMSFSSTANIKGGIQVGGSVSGSNNVNIFGTGNQLVTNSAPTAPPAFPDADLAAAKVTNNNSLIRIYNKFDSMGTEITGSAKTSILAGNSFGEGTIRLTGGTAGAPNVYFLKRINCTGKLRIRIDPPGPVKLYLDPDNTNDYVLGQAERYINHETVSGQYPKPTNMQIFIKKGRMGNGESRIYAGIFAPNSALTFSSSVWFYGVLVANTLSMTSSVEFHVDQSLLAPGGSGGAFARAWVEVAAP